MSVVQRARELLERLEHTKSGERVQAMERAKQTLLPGMAVPDGIRYA